MSSIYRVAADEIPNISITDKCIVLDLDSTLVHTQDREESRERLQQIMSDPKLLDLRKRLYNIKIEDIDQPGSGTLDEFWGITRPHIEEFLIFCFSYFRVVAVWSAGARLYVEAIVDRIFKNLPKPHIVFTKDDIRPKGTNIKDLELLFSVDPLISKTMNFENTFALDDTPSTFSRNQDNGVLIPKYEPDPQIDSLARDDPALLQFKYWLNQENVISSTDVREIDKSEIFNHDVGYYLENAKPASFKFYG